ncbi:FAD-dependent monooxygenase [Pseudaminobacter soli (ex Li et al. 2025)]|uniref:Salicylate hydroxylase n=1 Tax=Pseudaminobacter soli (ex Li et al. 2025) TaxID=1295366 RepID=A0A2P7S834_9HYPH|nr:FAD-dependent monooxygenase [Mesorhizobium soli]PSJ58475.1 salicylate hydroxylase [Mesorhizobium soli]
MDASRSGRVIIAGAGIAGLTAALAFARQGFSVDIYERSEKLEEVGAGLQLSPNATRILDRLGVLEFLLPKAVRPHGVILRDARTLLELARVPLGDTAMRRWHAPYLVAHRADLQSALLEAVGRQSSIRLTTGAALTGIAHQDQGVTVTFDRSGTAERAAGLLLIGADGVWSATRGLIGAGRQSSFSGEIAWRTVIDAESAIGRGLARIGARENVSAFLHSGFHLIAYPVRGGAAFNLVAFTPGQRIAEGWSDKTNTAPLERAMRHTAPLLSGLARNAGPWTAWPIHTVRQPSVWTAPGVALIGDAAHAMTPFAAQGAAMAIEDADTLATFLGAGTADLATALSAWERARRPRVEKVARRGAFNHFAWQAWGPVALARNLVLKTMPPEKLAADLDWLYGWESVSS